MTIFCRIIVKGIVSSQILASFSSWLLSKFCLGVKIVVCKSVVCMSGHIFSLRVFRIIWWVSVASRHFICSITCAKGDVILQQTASNLCHGSRLSGMPGAPIHDTFFWDHSAFTLTASFVSDYTSESVTCPSEYARPSSKISGTFMWRVTLKNIDICLQ